MTAHHCPACDTPVEAFGDGPSGRRNARCPHCGSLERHRLLALILDGWAGDLAEARTVLDIAPQSETRKLIRARTGGRYVGLDLDPARHPEVRGSITALPVADGSIDVIVCMHVLEHVPDDGAAIRELARVLTSTGVAFIQVPRRPGTATDEDPGAGEDERIRRFGQADHVRYYGDDFERRLYAGGLLPTALWPAMFLERADITRLGLKPDEHLWVAHTRRAGGDALPSRSALEEQLGHTERALRRLEMHPVVAGLRAVKRRLRA